MLKKTLKLLLCLALVITMLGATAAGAMADGEYSYKDGVLSIYNGTLSQETLLEALNTVANIQLPLRENYASGKKGDFQYAADLTAYYTKIYAFSVNGDSITAVSTKSFDNNTTYTLYAVETENKGSFIKPNYVTTYNQVATFTVSIYDKLYVTTNKNADKVTVNGTTVSQCDVPMKVYRGENNVRINAPALANHNVKIGSDDPSAFDEGATHTRTLTGDAEIIVTYTEAGESSVEIGDDADNKNVAFSKFSTLVKYNEEVTVTVTPKAGYYVDRVTVSGVSAFESSNYDEGVYTFTFKNTSTEATTYTINVDTESMSLALSDDSISFKKNQKPGDTESAIQRLIVSTPTISAEDNVTIKYDGRKTSIIGDPDWQVLGTESVRQFGINALGGVKDSEKILIELNPKNHKYPNISGEFTIKLDDSRAPAYIQAKDVEMTYSFKDCSTLEGIFNKVCSGVTTDAAGTDPIKTPLNIITSLEELSNGNMLMTMENQANKLDLTWMTGKINVGTYKVTLRFLGNDDYRASESVTVTLKINKAPATINAESIVKTYNGEKIYPISAKGEAPNQNDTINYTSFVAGIGVDPDSSYGGAAYLHINIPDEYGIRTSNIPGLEDLMGVLNKFGLGKNGNWTITINVSELSNYLEDILGALDMTLDSQAISFINQVISEINKIPNLNDVAYVKLSFGEDIMPKDAGVYLIGGILNDSNYTVAEGKQAFAVNYSIIKPKTAEEKLAFNVPDENGLYTLGTIADRDLGSKVASNENLNKDLHNLFVGVDAEGNPLFKLTDAAADISDVRKAGTYTQIAFLLDLGNSVHYATPIIRQITVVPDLVVVKFIDENGNENNERVFTYDGKAHGMTARVYSRGGAELPRADQERITYNYAGIEGDGEGYLSSSAPVKAGVYAVTATYKNADSTVYGAAVGTMIIKPSDDATITVDKETYATQGTKVHINNLVHSSPADAAKTVITSAVNVGGDFSKQGMSALSGIMNVDFPARLDNLLKNAGMELDKPLSTEGLRKVLASALSKVGISDSSLIKEAAALIDQLPSNLNLTFYDDVVYDDIGVYLVIGAITDPDYTLKTDSGIVVITPNVTKAALKWNHDDVNGIITRPVLTTKGILDASAYVDGEAAADEALTGKIHYLFIGLSGDAQLTTYTSAAQINKNGVYFQLAYIYDEISANIALVKPISRVFALVPQDVDIAIKPAVTTVDKTPYDMVGKNHVTVTKRDASPVQLDCLHLYYTGFDAEGNAYNSSKSPTAVGKYTVLALYVERDNAGKLRAAQPSLAEIDLNNIKYVGAGVGYLTVLPEGSDLPDNPIGPGNDDVNDALSNLPQTGDNSSMALWMALLSISAVALIIFRKRNANV